MGTWRTDLLNHGFHHGARFDGRFDPRQTFVPIGLEGLIDIDSCAMFGKGIDPVGQGYGVMDRSVGP